MGISELHAFPAQARREVTWSAWKLGFSSRDCLPSVSYGVTPQGRAFLGRWCFTGTQLGLAFSGEVSEFAGPVGALTKYSGLLGHRCGEVRVEMLSGTLCVFLDRTWVTFPGLLPALIRLESLTLQVDFNSILFAWAGRLESQFFLIPSCLRSRGVTWGWEGGLSHVVCCLVFSCPCPSWSRFLPMSLASFSDSRFSFY